MNYLPVVSANERLSTKCLVAAIGQDAEPVQVPEGGHEAVGHRVPARIVGAASLAHPQAKVWSKF